MPRRSKSLSVTPDSFFQDVSPLRIPLRRTRLHPTDLRTRDPLRALSPARSLRRATDSGPLCGLLPGMGEVRDSSEWVEGLPTASAACSLRSDRSPIGLLP